MACTCQPESASRQDRSSTSAPDVRRPPAGCATSRRPTRWSGEDRPPAPTSMPPTARWRGVLHHAASASAAGAAGDRGGQHRSGQARRLEQRLGEGGPPGLFEHTDQVDITQSETPGRLGDQEGRRSELGQHVPAFFGQRGPSSAPAASAARSAATGHSCSRTWRTACRRAHLSSEKAKYMSAPRQSEQALGHHVALDLVGAGVDGAGQREQIAVQPRTRGAASSSSASGPSRSERRRGWPGRSRTRRSCCSWPRGRRRGPRATLVAVQ